MKIIKRLLAVILTVAVLSAVSVTAWADSIADTAKNINSKEEITTKLYAYDDTADYKIYVSKSGMLELNVKLKMPNAFIYVYDENGEKISVADYDYISSDYSHALSSYQVGDDSFYTCWNDTVELYAASIFYQVNKGTYYIRIKRSSSSGNGDVNLIATYPQDTTATTSPAATDGSILSTIKSMLVYFTVDIPKGSTLQLGAITPNLSVPISWTSHNTNVATIATNGEVAAKAKGSAYIAIRFGPNVRIVQVNVV